jgi:hypothetical protein
LPENVLSLSASQRAWNGVRVDIAEFQCAGRVAHHLRDETETRLSVLLEEDDRSSERGGEITLGPLLNGFVNYEYWAPPYVSLVSLPCTLTIAGASRANSTSVRCESICDRWIE